MKARTKLFFKILGWLAGAGVLICVSLLCLPKEISTFIVVAVAFVTALVISETVEDFIYEENKDDKPSSSKRP